MKALRAIAQELTGLFVDDGLLAVSILFIVAIAAIAELLMADARIAGGVILLFGCLAVLVTNVLRAARK